MSKSFKYVSDFQFPSECGFTGSSGKTMVKGYARGGKPDMAHGGSHGTAKKAIANERAEMSRIKQETRSERKDAGQEMSRVRKEMRYDEAKLKSDRPMRKQYPTDRSEPMIKMMSGGMIKDRSKLGIEGNKNPGETKKHTAPDLPKPKTMMKSGGPVKKMANGGAMPPRGAAQAAAQLQGAGAGASQSAIRNAQQNAANQQMNTSGPQLIRPGQPVSPPRGATPVKTALGNTGGPRLAQTPAAPLSAKPMPGRPNPTQVNPARPKSPPPDVANAMASFQRDQSNMSPAAMGSIGQQAMLRGQQMNTSGQQLIRPGQPVSPSGGAAPRTQSAMMQAASMQGGPAAPRGPIAKPNMAQRGGPRGMAKGGMTPKQEAKVGKVMGEFKAGELHSGSKSGPMVKSRKQAVAIAMSEAGKKRK